MSVMWETELLVKYFQHF